jgi:hypothetical protein
MYAAAPANIPVERRETLPRIVRMFMMYVSEGGSQLRKLFLDKIFAELRL